MAKINILFNGAEYAIDEANLAPATGALKAHLATLKGEGGSLVLGEEAKFKDVITYADIEAYATVATPVYEGENHNMYLLYLDKDDNYPTAVINIATNYSGAILIYSAEAPETGGNVMYYLGEIEGLPSPEGRDGDGWYYAADVSNPESNLTVVKTTAPTTILPTNIQLTTSLEAISIFFDLGGNEGNLDITLDGAVYKVDSTKLAPATNNLIAHLETLKGGDEGGGGLVEGETYTFKSYISDEEINEWLKNAVTTEAGEYQIYGTTDGTWGGAGVNLSIFGGNSYGNHIDITFEDGSVAVYGFSSFFESLSSSGFTVADDVENWGALSMITQTVTKCDPPTVTIPSPTITPENLEISAVFFDIPSAGGSLNYDEEVQFKALIPLEDINTFIDNNITSASSGEMSALQIINGVLTCMCFTDIKCGQFMYSKTNNEILSYAFNVEVGIAAGKTNPAMNEDGWWSANMSDQTMTKLSEPPTITIPSGTTVTPDLESISFLFDLGGGSGNEGDTKIVINGTEHWIDSTKLAEAKSALAAHLKALEDASN